MKKEIMTEEEYKVEIVRIYREKIRRRKKIAKIVLCITIPLIVMLSYFLITIDSPVSSEEYKRINVEERQYKKDNIDKLVKSSSEGDYYVDIYKGNAGYFVVDFYSSVEYKNIGLGLHDWGGPIARAEQLTADDIDVEWGKDSDKIVYVKVSVKEGDRRVQPITIYTILT